MSPTIPTPGRLSSRDLTTLITGLERTLTTVRELRRQMGLDVGLGTRPALGNALHDAFVDYSLDRSSRLREVALRPLARGAKWLDMPTLREFDTGTDEESDRAARWRAAFPRFDETVTNLFANEEYVVVERRSQGIQEGALQLAGGTIPPTRRHFAVESADVLRIEQGFITRIEHYYDMAGILRRLGLMPDIPLGHDERDATPPPVLHATGFLPLSGDLRRGADPRLLEGHVSIGSSRTPEAEANRRNCLQIHEAFIEHDPDRFSELIAPDGVWIDVPTGEVLSAAAAAAHHDHSNWQTAFPDSSAEVTNMVVNEDWVGVQHRGFGTHDGELRLGGRTYAPTGRRVDIRVLDVVGYAGGRAQVIRNYYDVGMMLIQLGIVPGGRVG